MKVLVTLREDRSLLVEAHSEKDAQLLTMLEKDRWGQAVVEKNYFTREIKVGESL